MSCLSFEDKIPSCALSDIKYLERKSTILFSLPLIYSYTISGPELIVSKNFTHLFLANFFSMLKLLINFTIA